MLDVKTILWMISEYVPPIAAGVIAGLWLAWRGHRVFGSLFLLWSAVQVSWIALLHCGWRWDVVCEQFLALILADENEVFKSVAAAYRTVDVLAVVVFVAVVLRRRAGDP